MNIFGDELDNISINIYFYNSEKKFPNIFIGEVHTNNIDVSNISVDYNKE